MEGGPRRHPPPEKMKIKYGNRESANLAVAENLAKHSTKQKTFTIKNSVGKALKIKMDCIHLIYDIEEKARDLFEIAEDGTRKLVDHVASEN